MIVLCHKAHETLLAYQHPNLGRLLSPRHYARAAASASLFPVAADNDCFQGLDRPAFVAMLEAIAGTPLLFISVPDVVADARATARRFVRWRDRVAAAGPVALCAQDGLRSPPWDELDALFIGGSTNWKVSNDARRLVLEAKERGKWTHMGRVNSTRRVLIAKAWGIDSIDGSSVSMFTDTHLPRRLYDAAALTQLALD